MPPIALTPPSDATRASMRANRRRDTGPELRLRSALHRAGLRFFVDRPPVRGLRRRADLVFPRLRVAVFVDGCFWHGCPIHGTRPKANREFWRDKIENNKRRDVETNAALAGADWVVIRIWEHEAVDEAAERVIGVVSERKGALGLNADHGTTGVAADDPEQVTAGPA